MNDHTAGSVPAAPSDMEAIEPIAPRRSARLSSRTPTPAVTAVRVVAKKAASKKRAVTSAPVSAAAEPAKELRVVYQATHPEDVDMPPPPSVPAPLPPVTSEPAPKAKKAAGRKKKAKSPSDRITEEDVHAFFRFEGMQSQRRVKTMIADAFSAVNQKRIAFIVLRSAIKCARDNKRKRVMVRDVEPALSAVMEVLSLLVTKDPTE